MDRYTSGNVDHITQLLEERIDPETQPRLHRAALIVLERLEREIDATTPRAVVVRALAQAYAAFLVEDHDTMRAFRNAMRQKLREARR